MDDLFPPRKVHHEHPADALRRIQSVARALGMEPGVEAEVTIKVTFFPDDGPPFVRYFPDRATWDWMRPYLEQDIPSFEVEDVHGILTPGGEFEPR